MYDALTARFTFACPARGQTRVALSAFRRLERLPGAAHPAVYRVLFDCACGEKHDGLVAHDDLDWAPLGLGGGVFFNFMTAHFDPLEDELSDLAARRLQAGEWPWSFFCYPEERPRPVLSADVDQPRFASACRHSLAQRRPGGRRRTRPRGRHRDDGHGVPRRARIQPLRQPTNRSLARLRCRGERKNPSLRTSEVIECTDSPGPRQR